jgi:hypothetical protein
MRAWCVPVLLIAAVILSSCGTATYTHDISVLINDPSGRLGPGSVEVSIFDRQMGSSPDWARRSMGTASEGAPYKAELFTTRVKTFLSEDLPGQVVAALAIPAYEKNGYFVVSIAPDPAAEKTIVAPFAPYGDDFRDGDQVKPLPVRYTSQPGEHGWTITITVDVPPVR